VEKIGKILSGCAARPDQRARSVDLMDILCTIGEMVVSGNVRRSAILILGDPDDEDYLRSKRWDLGTIPSQRAMANLSVVVGRYEDLGPLFWETYRHGEPFGLVNRKNIQTYGRMGEKKQDNAIGVNPCAEATLSQGEPCNLQEIFLPRLQNEAEFVEAARLMHRWGTRVTCEKYHIPLSQEIVAKNRRIGTSITGCLQSPLFKADVLDRVYASLQEENRSYSKELGIPESIRTTLVKPSGTLSLLGDVLAGIHPAFSKWFIRRVRFSSLDPIVEVLHRAGHPVEASIRIDGSQDPTTSVVSFFCEAPENAPVADQNWDSFKQLDVVRMVQKHWADQSVSVTVYYRREELGKLQSWLQTHLGEIKTLSFLSQTDHGFVQAPIEAISQERYQKESSALRPVDLSTLAGGFDLEAQDCEGNACPVK
jgi:ribonucleotide reductase alpha subunit